MSERFLCSVCNEERPVAKRQETKTCDFKFQGHTVEVEVAVYHCEVCGKDTYPIDPHIVAVEKLRTQLGWTQPVEIVQLRKAYGLTQSEFSQILGWGVATLSRYENGALQSESHESVLGLLRNDPTILVRLIHNNSTLPRSRREELLAALRPKKSDFISTLFNTVYPKDNEDEFSGLRKFDLSRLKSLILFFCRSGCLKTNLNKLLFYADFKAFKDLKRSITGARYVRINYGPVVNDFNFYFASLVEDGSLELEEVFYPNGYVGEKYTATLDPDLSFLDQKERELLILIKRKLGGLNATDIAELSHKEQAYLHTVEKQPISYSWAKDLSI